MPKETHPDWYRDLTPMKCLILGSYPPHESKRDYPFYYPNAMNNFWKVLADIAKIKLQYTKKSELKTQEAKSEAVEERFKIMQTLNAGVQNVGKIIMRNGNSSLDTNIEIIEEQDILSIIEKHKELERILLAGFSAKNSTARSFLRYLSKKGISYEIENIRPEEKFFINVFGRKIECVILNSTSTAGTIKYKELREQFRKYLA